MTYDPFKTGSITLEQLQAVAKAQKTEIRFGDILIIRSGYIAAFNDLSKDQARAYASVIPPPLSGVEQSENILQVSDTISSVRHGRQPYVRWHTIFFIQPI